MYISLINKRGIVAHPGLWLKVIVIIFRYRRGETGIHPSLQHQRFFTAGLGGTLRVCTFFLLVGFFGEFLTGSTGL